ncbi:MAG TPA: histidine ammonia-lyase [Saprospiraceae bacterium]|nr:histidine ammonia-lyase [Saprospiraceae bacterium]
MNANIVIENRDLSLEDIISIWKSKETINLSDVLWQNVSESRTVLEKLLSIGGNSIYGINTGFGSLCNTVIPEIELDQLQYNLVRSHACGTGNYISKESSRLVLLLKIISLSKGNSCIRSETLQFLIKLYNEDIIPAIPEMGSLGASGDLAPLAHLSLPILGEGSVWKNNSIISTTDFVKNGFLETPGLKAKEGLALLNGTQYSLALMIDACNQSIELIKQANYVASLSMEAYDVCLDFLNPEIHELRKQTGQIQIAKNLLNILSGTFLDKRAKNAVQDPYSFRCIPQVHGATLDTINFVIDIIQKEINAVTDNPVLLSDSTIKSGGNFHAQPLALCADFLSIAMAEIGSISERRLYKLIDGNRELPEFLTENPGLNSGFMIVQYSAAALVSINKQFATPSSVDSIVTSKGQEDHVSMAANAGIKCLKIISHIRQILTMEWMTATRAWNFRNKWELGPELKQIVEEYRTIIPYKKDDHIPSDDYKPTLDFLSNKIK